MNIPSISIKEFRASDYCYVSGVYSFRNRYTRKRYIGSSNDIYKRISQHLGRFGCMNKKFAHAWHEYDKSAWRIEILEVVPRPSLLKKTEQKWIDVFDSLHNGYNGTSVIGHRSYARSVSGCRRKRRRSNLTSKGMSA